MKKAWLLLALAFLFCLAGCGGQPAADKAPAKKLKVVATIFPVYDWTRAIAGASDNMELTLLLGRGIDMHSYQPSAEDLMKISTADVFLYVGGESDGWVKNALKEAANKDMVVVNLMEALGSRAKAEEHVEGMEPGHHHHGHDHGHDHDHDRDHKDDHDHDHDRDHKDDHDHDHDRDHKDDHDHDHDRDHKGDHDHDHDRDHKGDHDHDHDRDHKDDHDHDHEHDPGHRHAAPEYDEHVWLSLKNAVVLTDAVTEALAKADARNAETYRKNAAAYKEKLTALDAAYQKTVQSAARRTLLFADRFPFRYLTEDYDLTYYAAFPGCSAETEASFQTVAFLAGKLSELQLPAVLVIEGGDKRIAQAVIQNAPGTQAKVLVMDSMQGTTAQEAGKGTSYLGVMEKNLTVLKEALR